MNWIIQVVYEVSSEYGRGSVFIVSIPQKVLGEERFGIWEDVLHAGRGTEHRIGIFTVPATKILVVDDNPMNLIVLAECQEQAFILTVLS